MSRLVLVVDDSPSLRQMTAYTLEDAGYRVEQASNGAEALARLAGTAGVACALVDLNMPEMDGLTFIRRLRASAAHGGLPIIVVSTDDQPARKREAIEAGATAYVVKPYAVEDLLHVVGAALR